MPGNGRTFLALAVMAGNGWKWLEMTGNGWELLEMAGNNWNWLELTDIA